MSKKIVFFDVDGTLLSYKTQQIPHSTLQAIQKLKEKGHYVAIATGRPHYLITDLKNNMEIDHYVTFNGRCSFLENEVIDKKIIDTIYIQQLVDVCAKYNVPLLFEGMNDLYATKIEAFLKEYLDRINVPYPKIDPLYYKKDEIFQCAIFTDLETESKIKQELDFFDFVRYNEFGIDVMPKGVMKESGIQKILEHLKLDPMDAYAFGDGLNDIGMLQFVGTGIAMGNAHDELKKVANHITDDCDEDGIYNALIKFGLIEC